MEEAAEWSTSRRHPWRALASARATVGGDRLTCLSRWWSIQPGFEARGRELQGGTSGHDEHVEPTQTEPVGSTSLVAGCRSRHRYEVAAFPDGGPFSEPPPADLRRRQLSETSPLAGRRSTKPNVDAQDLGFSSLPLSQRGRVCRSSRQRRFLPVVASGHPGFQPAFRLEPVGGSDSRQSLLGSRLDDLPPFCGTRRR